MLGGDSKSACEFRVVRHFSTEKRCIALSEWADQKHQEAKKLHAEQNKRDQKRYEERKKWDDKKDEERDKEILREQLKQQARTQRLLREIRNERNS